jgi:hypothetical protein
LRVSVIDWSGVTAEAMKGPFERNSDGSVGSDLVSKPVFQKSARAWISGRSTGFSGSPAGAVWMS